MSDNESGKAKTWTEHEVLVYLLSAIDHHKLKIDFHNAPAPAGRNQSGCSQKMGRIKKALQAEIDAIQKGESIETSVELTPKKAAGRKRKSAATDDGEAAPKKRGRPEKKDAAPKAEEDVSVKGEPEVEADMPAEDQI